MQDKFKTQREQAIAELIAPIELLPPPMVYVHASEGRVYGAGNFAYRQKITIGNLL